MKIKKFKQIVDGQVQEVYIDKDSSKFIKDILMDLMKKYKR